MKKQGTRNITYTQRLQIETLTNAKVSKQDIAKTIGINIRTLYYELKRGECETLKTRNNFWTGNKLVKVKSYSAQIAQERHNIACTSKGRPLKIGKDFEFIRYIEQRILKDKLSACAVLGEIKRNKLFETDISKTTLYRYIEIGLFENLSMKNISCRKKQYRHVMKRAPKGTSIEKRPLEIKERKTFGHWEMDCVCGPTKPVLLVLSERLTRKEIIFAMPNQRAESVVLCLNKLERRFGKNFRKVFKSITMDNGVEFSDVKGIERSIYKGKRTTTYYCHPYCSCERGTNERLNREIRRLIPKGSDISKYSDKDIAFVENWVNNYPREVLNFATSSELFAQQMSLIA